MQLQKPGCLLLAENFNKFNKNEELVKKKNSAREIASFISSDVALIWVLSQ